MSAKLEKYKGFLESRAFAPVMAVIVLFGHLFGLEIVSVGIFTVLTVSVFTMLDTARPAMVSLCLFMYQLSRQNSLSAPSNSDFLKSPPAVICMVLYGTAIISSIVYFLIKHKIYLKIKGNIPLVLYATFAFSLTLCLNGIFSGVWSINNLFFALIQAFVYIFFYMLFYYGISDKDSAQRLTDDIIDIASVSALILIVEMTAMYLTADNIFIDGSINKEAISLGWGIYNPIGGMLVVLIPLIFLAIIRGRRLWVYLPLAALTYIFGVLTLSRNALLFGTLAFAACCVICAFWGENKRFFRICILAALAVFALGVIVLWDKISAVFADFINRGFSDNGRYSLWAEAIESFRENIVFGSGFFAYDADYFKHLSFMPELPHNTILAFLSAGGILLTLVYLAYRAITLIPLFKKPSVEFSLLTMSFMLLPLMSLLDNFILNFYPTFLYTLTLVVITKATQRNK
ncbi:MAG: O-antigen ligase family protein [Clostridia bacterium]|nr:O-antigen ligase family protein [Clostridia bacterium]